MKNYESIDKTLNISSDVVSSDEETRPNAEIVKTSSQETDDIKKDYDYTRANLYSLIEKGQEAIDGIMELAIDGGSPRAYEVAGQLIKNVADTTDKLIDWQKNLTGQKEILAAISSQASA